MPYTITITEIRTEKKKVQPDYCVIGTDEVARKPEFLSLDEPDPKEPKTRIVDVRGYPPAVGREVEKKITLLEQTVDQMDLKAVIKAINSI